MSKKLKVVLALLEVLIGIVWPMVLAPVLRRPTSASAVNDGLLELSVLKIVHC